MVLESPSTVEAQEPGEGGGDTDDDAAGVALYLREGQVPSGQPFILGSRDLPGTAARTSGLADGTVIALGQGSNRQGTG